MHNKDDQKKTKGQPIEELAEMRRQVAELEKSEAERIKAEGALREAEEKYRNIFENAIEGIYRSTPDGRYLTVNPALAHIYGYDSPDELIAGINSIEQQLYVKPELRQTFMAKLEKEGEIKGFEIELYQKNGGTFWISTNARAIRDADGKMLCYEGTSEDITERKLAVREMKKSELRYRSLVESSPDAIILLEEETVLYFNPAASKLLGSGKDRKRLVGRKILDFIYPEDREAVRRGIDTIRQTGNMTPAIEVKLIRDDGGIVYVECSGSAAHYNGLTLLQMIMRDISGRIRAEAVLGMTRQQQKAILDNIPDIAWLKDKESRFILANEPFGKACGVRPEDLPGKTDLDIWPRALAEKYRADDREVMQSGIRRQIEEPLIDKEGNTTWIETIKTAIRHDRGEVIGTAGIARDITVRKRQEEELRQYREQLERLVEERTAELTKVNALLQQELSEHKLTEEKVQGLNRELEQRVSELNITNKELETFNYSVSHDLRTPLIAIEGFSRILMEKYGHHLDEKGQHLLGMINRNTKRMGELIEDLLEFFSLGRKNIKFTTIDMEKITNDIITDFKTVFPDDTFHIGLDQLPPAYGDKKMVRQVLINLMGNAIKYSRPKGAALIRVGGWMEEDKNTYYVKDNGIGFPMEEIDKIFEVFERLHGSDEIEGTGVGLAIVKRVVLKHGGGVWAEAKADEGATFYFSLPGRGQ
ncbi:MAG: PAS domain S-box protein [Proteobacteria bacterium]|nr:PAS domain S-box protein [Pseudomonadota bacterium]